MPKNAQTHLNPSKVMLKILQARLQQSMNHELPDAQAGFRKDRGTRDQIANICWIIKKAREFQKKTCISALLTMPKSLTVWITTNYTIALISHISKVMLKILQARLQQYVNHELPNVQAGFRKGRGTRDQIAKTSAGSSKKQENSRKTSISAL